MLGRFVTEYVSDVSENVSLQILLKTWVDSYFPALKTHVTSIFNYFFTYLAPYLKVREMIINFYEALNVFILNQFLINYLNLVQISQKYLFIFQSYSVKVLKMIILIIYKT